jgi:hypothetical protein
MANIKRLKHYKIKNTGLMFELLLRQITADVLNKDERGGAVKIVKSRFTETTELGKELQLYQVLINQRFKSDKQADYFINEVLSRRATLNHSQLRREKYNVIRDIKENYNVDKFFSSKVPEYKIYASIYKLFEYASSISPEEKTESFFNILEHVTTNKSTDVISENNSKDSDLRILSYKILLEKFNKKYSKLDSNQKTLLKTYINNVSNTNHLKEYVESKIPEVKRDIKKLENKVKDKVVKIKLKEALNSINKFCGVGKSKLVKDTTVVQMMRYFELVKELKKVGR